MLSFLSQIFSREITVQKQSTPPTNCFPLSNEIKTTEYIYCFSENEGKSNSAKLNSIMAQKFEQLFSFEAKEGLLSRGLTKSKELQAVSRVREEFFACLEESNLLSTYIKSQQKVILQGPAIHEKEGLNIISDLYSKAIMDVPGNQDMALYAGDAFVCGVIELKEFGALQGSGYLGDLFLRAVNGGATYAALLVQDLADVPIEYKHKLACVAEKRGDTRAIKKYNQINLLHST